jgi:DNA-binding CsgD family transcriptional regulator
MINQFTQQQSKVAALVKQALSNEEIASNLGINKKTVKGHTCAIFKKLGVKSRAALIKSLYEKDLLLAKQELESYKLKATELDTELNKLKRDIYGR